MMDMREELDSLLQKEMDRKDFLKLVGISFVTITGVMSVLKTLNSLTGSSVSHSKRTHGYGTSAYGGGHKSSPLS